MRKALTAALAALTLGGAVSATAVTGADARPYYHGGYGGYGGYHHGGNGGAALVAGVAGLAIGAALASDHPHYYRGYYGAPAYYYDAPAPYYYGPATCYSTRWVWDPYIGRRVPQRVAYAC
ncbi:MAG: hypothetical protein JSR98_07110 [Proteobacteria bacterium]|nr:hypothetical protein [Pseudomonadota bacterium]